MPKQNKIVQLFTHSLLSKSSALPLKCWTTKDYTFKRWIGVLVNILENIFLTYNLYTSAKFGIINSFSSASISDSENSLGINLKQVPCINLWNQIVLLHALPSDNLPTNPTGVTPHSVKTSLRTALPNLSAMNVINSNFSCYFS